MVNGILLLDKPIGISSHDLVNMVRRVLKQKRVGHAGILDPLATGLMVMLLGKGTLFSPQLTGSDKRYSAVLSFGKSTNTFDSEGQFIEEKDPGKLDLSEFKRACDSFIGNFKQLVPPFSAVKLNGKRMYKSARDGEEVPAKYKEVNVYSIDILTFDWPDVSVDIKCGAGTYVRSLAHELGQKLGCGGYLKKLVRTGIGDFDLDDTISIEKLEEAVGAGDLSAVKPLVDAFPDRPTIKIRSEYCKSILEGKPFIKRYLERTDYKGPGGCLSLLLGPEEKVLAVVTLNYNWGSYNRLEGRDVLGKYVRIIDEGHIRN
ncbi:MAG: tRNA pseudouridine(55) synthase TruB [candidate division Zixibacteria bacterium]|nr:tRNA pseudouridine(55) synthase TruB [candidate division Zixibacteria bacterium]